MDEPRKRLGCWWLLVPVALMFALFLLQLIGRSPKIRVSRKTTYIESHLGKNGLPDYKAYLHDQLQPNIRPEENAAVLIWKALWPGELEGNEAHQQLVCEALNIPLPDPFEALEPLVGVEAELGEWIQANVLQGDNEEVDEDEMTEEVEDYVFHAIDQSRSIPWKGTEIPRLAKWVKDNQQPIDWLVEGVAREKYYNPSPNMVDGSDESIFLVLLPGVQTLREGARALLCRAMYHLGNDDPESAWRDLRACHRLARHVQKGFTIVEQLVAIAIDGMASHGTQVLLHHGNLTQKQAAEILGELQQLPQLRPMNQVIGEGERICYLDTVQRLSVGRLDLSDLEMGSPLQQGTRLRINWNLVMQQGNNWYDRMAAAGELPRAERLIVMDKMAIELASLRPTSGSLAQSVFSPKARSQTVSNILLNLMLPAVSNCYEASDRSLTLSSMNEIAAALAVHRAREGSYPEQLEALVPATLSKLPLDIYSGKPFIYQRSAEGYCLYSVYINGHDDRGRDISGKIENGKWVSSILPSTGDCDLVILMPQPDFEYSIED